MPLVHDIGPMDPAQPHFDSAPATDSLRLTASWRHPLPLLGVLPPAWRGAGARTLGSKFRIGRRRSEVKLLGDLLNESYLICVRRWDRSDVSLLPEYFNKFFVKLMSIFRESEDELEAGTT